MAAQRMSARPACLLDHHGRTPNRWVRGHDSHARTPDRFARPPDEQARPPDSMAQRGRSGRDGRDGHAVKERHGAHTYLTSAPAFRARPPAHRASEGT